MRRFRPLVLLLAALATVGCGVDAWYFESITSGLNTGSTLVLVWFSDSPVDEATNLWLTVESVDWVGAQTTTRVFTGPRQIDLLALRNGVREALGQAQVPVETARALRLRLAADGGGRHRIRVAGVDHELLFDAPGDALVELPLSVTLVKDATLEVQVDLDARLSVLQAGGSWWLRPQGLALDTARAGFLAGGVLDGAALPLVGAVVSAQQAGQEIASTLSGSGGLFRLGPLPPGAYEIVASLAGHAPAGIGPVPVGAGGTSGGQQLVLGSVTPGSVAGTVTAAAPGQFVRLYGPLGFLAQVGVDPLNGLFDLPSVAPGTYSAELWDATGRRSTQGGLVVSPGQPLAVSL